MTIKRDTPTDETVNHIYKTIRKHIKNESCYERGDVVVKQVKVGASADKNQSNQPNETQTQTKRQSDSGR